MNQHRAAVIFGAILTATFLTALGMVSCAGPAHATQPSFICEPLDSGKIDVPEGYTPATVTATAPEGFLIDGYCVKAGTTKFYIEVTPPSATVVVDHPEKDSVSHYSLSYVAVTPPPPTVHEEVGLYCYEKLDATLPAAWENSGLQTLAASKAGTEWFTDSEARELCDIPLESCEPKAHAYQQDKVRYTDTFTWLTNIQYPTDNIGWPPIYDARHGDLPQKQLPTETCNPTPTPEPTPPTSAPVPTVTTLPVSGPANVGLLLGIGIPLALLGALLVAFTRTSGANHASREENQ